MKPTILKRTLLTGAIIVVFIICSLEVSDTSAQSYGPIQNTKPGDCPTYDDGMLDDGTLIKCLTCETDCQCPEDYKCCQHPSCKGLVCVPPAKSLESEPTCNADIARPTKRGTCPWSLNDMDCKDKRCVDQCTSDCECYGTEICCPTKNCGNVCSKPSDDAGTSTK